MTQLRWNSDGRLQYRECTKRWFRYHYTEWQNVGIVPTPIKLPNDIGFDAGQLATAMEGLNIKVANGY